MLILFAAPALWADYATILPEALAEAGLSAQIVTEPLPPAAIAAMHAVSTYMLTF